MKKKGSVTPKHPVDRLPRNTGKYRYVSPYKDGRVCRARGGGFVDRKGNIWE